MACGVNQQARLIKASIPATNITEPAKVDPKLKVIIECFAIPSDLLGEPNDRVQMLKESFPFGRKQFPASHLKTYGILQ